MASIVPSKRKRGKKPTSSSSLLCASNTDDVGPVLRSRTRHASALSLSVSNEPAIVAENVSPKVLEACRAAVINCPAASRVALSKYSTCIDPTLANVLEVVGNYNDEHTPLHESVRRGDDATLQYLICAGAEIDDRDYNWFNAIDLATDDACRDLLVHHKTVLTALEEDPAALVAAAIAHFSALSSSSALVTDTELNLSGYHYDPSFLWAPYEARTAVFTWARDAFMVVFATNSDPYSELPDDCAGDVLEYLMGNMTRRESLHISMHCTSLQARAWVCAMFKAAVADKLKCELKFNRLGFIQKYISKGACVDTEIKVSDTLLGSSSRHNCTALVSASVNGCTDIVELLLQAGANTELKDESRKTGLMYASEHGYSAVVDLLLKAGANTENKDRMGFTALVGASVKGHAATVELLLRAGANTEAIDEDGITSLMRASMKGHADVVKLLLEAGAQVDAIENYNGRTALSMASQLGHAAVVELLLQAGADIELRDFGDDKPLHVASSYNCAGVVRLLLQAGANKEARDKDKRTPLLVALKVLLEAGAKIEVKSDRNEMPLQEAISDGFVAVRTLPFLEPTLHPSNGPADIVRLLLEAGANMNIQNSLGDTPLISSCACGNAAIAKLFIENGANMEAKNRDGETGLIVAASLGRKNYIATVETLLSAGADIEGRDVSGATALIRASENGQTDMVKFLLEAGANKDATDRLGSTSLIKSSAKGQNMTVKLLLEAGANKDAVDNRGKSALDHAQQRCQFRVVSLFE